MTLHSAKENSFFAWTENFVLGICICKTHQTGPEFTSDLISEINISKVLDVQTKLTSTDGSSRAY